jgi:pyridoxamine 5'-phosphate oxidase
LKGQARIETASETANSAWAASTPFARRCYLAEAAPGTVVGEPTSGLPKAVEGRQPEESELAPARANFAILLFTFAEIEWLYLANSGHRRARWLWDSVAGRWDGCWLVP